MMKIMMPVITSITALVKMRMAFLTNDVCHDHAWDAHVHSLGRYDICGDPISLATLAQFM